MARNDTNINITSYISLNIYICPSEDLYRIRSIFYSAASTCCSDCCDPGWTDGWSGLFEICGKIFKAALSAVKRPCLLFKQAHLYRSAKACIALSLHFNILNS